MLENAGQMSVVFLSHFK